MLASDYSNGSASNGANGMSQMLPEDIAARADSKYGDDPDALSAFLENQIRLRNIRLNETQRLANGFIDSGVNNGGVGAMEQSQQNLQQKRRLDNNGVPITF